jgi:hypothetical protein
VRSQYPENVELLRGNVELLAQSAVLGSNALIRTDELEEELLA